MWRNRLTLEGCLSGTCHPGDLHHLCGAGATGLDRWWFVLSWYLVVCALMWPTGYLCLENQNYFTPDCHCLLSSGNEVFFAFQCCCPDEFEFPKIVHTLEFAFNNSMKFRFFLFNIMGILLWISSVLLFFSCLWQWAVCWISHPAVVLIRWGKACWELW